jgi:16S rRNA (cytidine1402-2'-O)-methyltransferase
VVAFESPQRLPRSLAALARVIPGRQAAICRELTKRFEEVGVGTVAELAARFAEAPKGEVTLVLGAAPVAGPDEGAATDAVAELVAAGLSRRQAAEVVSRLTGVARNRLYRTSL